MRGRITDAFIDALPMINGVKTGPRKSGWVHRDEDELRHSLDETNAMRHILTGRLDGHGDALTLTLELYETHNNKPVWTEMFSGKTNEVVALERRAIQRIAGKLELSINKEEDRQIGQTLTNNLEALTLHRLGGKRFNTEVNVFNDVRKLALEAQRLDSNYLDAHFLDVYMSRLIAYDRASTEVWPEIERSVKKILTQDDAHTGALDFLSGCFMVIRHDWTNADIFMARAEQWQSEQWTHFYLPFNVGCRGQSLPRHRHSLDCTTATNMNAGPLLDAVVRALAEARLEAILIIASKRAAGRLRDQAVLEILEKTLRKKTSQRRKREAALRGLRRESERAELDLIRRRLALPVEK